jgi:replicative DNA helicase
MRTLPHWDDAEQQVIGSCLIDNDTAIKIVAKLTPNDFYNDELKDIFSAIVNVVNKGIVCDLVSVSDELIKNGKEDLISTATLLAGSMLTSINALYYADIVKEKSQRRQVIFLTERVSAKAFDESADIDTILSELEEEVFKIRTIHNDVQDFNVLLSEAFDVIEQRGKMRGMTGMPSGLIRLDSITGGFQQGDLIVLASRPSVGKTSLAVNMAEHMAVDKKLPVLFFSLEMSSQQIVERMLVSRARINSQLVKTGHLQPEDWEKLVSTMGELGDSPFIIDDSAELSLPEIRARSRKMKIEHDIRAIFIDYLQLVSLGKKAESKVIEVAQITRGLKALAKELSVPVIILSQLNRQIERRDDGEPYLSDLRDSGAIESDADIVLFLTRPDKDNRNVVDLTIAKNRSGATGVVPLFFMAECTRFAARYDDDESRG